VLDNREVLDHIGRIVDVRSGGPEVIWSVDSVHQRYLPANGGTD
jgi:hypothetical protein